MGGSPGRISLRGKVQKYFRFAALCVASAAFSISIGANSLAASPAASRLRQSAARASSHSARKAVHTPRRRSTVRIARSRISAHSSVHARPGVHLARYSRPPQQQTKPSATTKKKKTRRRRRSRRQSFQKAPTPERISEIQSALARGGYFQGDPNGKWDANTVNALQKFQSANGLEPSGKLDAPSLQKMGLGSDIAGVSAPKPLPPAGSVPPASTPRPPASAPANPPAAPPAAAPANPSKSASPSSAVVSSPNPAPPAARHAEPTPTPFASPASSSPR